MKYNREVQAWFSSRGFENWRCRMWRGRQAGDGEMAHRLGTGDPMTVLTNSQIKKCRTKSDKLGFRGSKEKRRK